MSDCHQVVNGTLASLLESDGCTNSTTKVGEPQFDGYRKIVCVPWKLFSAARNGNFGEAQGGIIDLHTDDEHTVGRKLTYLCTANFDNEDQAKVPSA